MLKLTRLLGAIALTGFSLAGAPGLAPAQSALAQSDPGSNPNPGSNPGSERAEGDVAGPAYFYDALNEDGAWVEHPRFGMVWQPDVDDAWRPYTIGRWAYSDAYGWTWLSDEPFGWAVYHYGRWSRDGDYGWFWVPGSEWAPAWVLWRYNDEAVGWAPMPPETRFDRGRVFADPGFYESRRFLPRWVFASPKSFTRPGIDRYVRPASWNRDLISRTRSRLSYDVVDNRVVNRGVPPEDMEKMLRGPVPRAKILPVDKDETRSRQFSKLGDKADLGDVELYRPDRARSEDIVRGNPTPRTAGKPKHRGEFGRLPPQRRDRFEREDRQLSDDTRRPRRNEEDAREPDEERGGKPVARQDDGAPDRDGTYRPWKRPDSGIDDNSLHKAVRRNDDDATREPPPPGAGETAPPTARDRVPPDEKTRNAVPDEDTSLPVDEPPVRDKKSTKKRDAGLAPATMPEPELIDPAPGKKGGKPVEFYEEVPPDEAGGPPAGPGAPDASSATEPPARARPSTPRSQGRFGNAAAPSPEPERAEPERADRTRPAAVEIDDDPVSAMDAPAKRKLPADAEPAKQAGKTSAAKSPDDPPSKPRASGTSVEKPKAESPAPEAEQTAATGSNPARKKPSAEARSKAQSPDESEDNGKPKRRWDQNGASGSGYPTVVGPDGKEAPN